MKVTAKFNLINIIICCLIILISFVWLYYQFQNAYLRLYNFKDGYDLLIYLQKIYNTCRGKPWLSLEYGDDWRFHHTDFSVLLLTPFLCIFPNPLTLKYIQVIILWVTSILIFCYVKREINFMLAFMMFLLFLFHPSISFSAVYGFHGRILFPFFFLLYLYFNKTKRKLSYIFLALACFSDEIGCMLLVILFATKLFLSKFQKEKNNIKLEFIITFLLFITQVIIIQLATNKPVWKSAGKRWVGIKGLFMDSPKKLHFIKNIALTTILTMSISYLIPFIICILLYLAVTPEWFTMYMIEFHYFVIPLTFAIGGTPEFIKKVYNNKKARIVLYTYFLVILSILFLPIFCNKHMPKHFFVTYNYLPWNLYKTESSYYKQIDKDCYKLLEKAISMISEEDIILTQWWLLPFFFKAKMIFPIHHCLKNNRLVSCSLAITYRNIEDYNFILVFTSQRYVPLYKYPYQFNILENDLLAKRYKILWKNKCGILFGRK